MWISVRFSCFSNGFFKLFNYTISTVGSDQQINVTVQKIKDDSNNNSNDNNNNNNNNNSNNNNKNNNNNNNNNRS